ncbi:Acyl-CoA-binding domain-containing protein 5, partial [Eschrichtius robustus]|nr:Acyl-CoA-binding domain-containing protein 5 [Eschrichtius robustus]
MFETLPCIYSQDLGNVLTSTPNAKTLNGKAESSDSGAESEEEEAQEGVKGAEQSDNDKKMMKKSADHKNLEIVVTNGYEKDSFVQGVQNDIHASPSLNGRGAETVKSVDQNLEQTEKTAVCVHQDVQVSPGNGNRGDTQAAAVEGKGEVKHGGEDGGSNSGAPHREKRAGESEEFSNIRRGRGHRMQHLSEGSKGRQVGSGGDGERWGSDRGSRGSLNEQIALVLMRLQEDMQNVLQRLHKLETLTASQ